MNSQPKQVETKQAEKQVTLLEDVLNLTKREARLYNALTIAETLGMMSTGALLWEGIMYNRPVAAFASASAFIMAMTARRYRSEIAGRANQRTIDEYARPESTQPNEVGS